MGACSCKGMGQDTTEVEVEKSTSIKNTQQSNGKFNRIKSIRIKDNNDITNMHKISKLIQNYENKDEEPQDKSTDEEKKENDLIFDYEINETELALIRESLTKHFLFKDMDEELL